MSEQSLSGMKIAILATDGFEQVELTEPRQALDQAGAQTELVSPKRAKCVPGNPRSGARSSRSMRPLDDADPSDYDALVLPGGVMNPDKLRMEPKAVAFVKAFFDAGKPVAAICHGPWMVIEPGAARGHRMTSWPSLKTDIRNAGGNWVDEEVVVDGNLITSRKPDDIPAFNRELIKVFGESRSQPQRSAVRAQPPASPAPTVKVSAAEVRDG